MKRSLGALGLFLSGAFASGCPVYSDNVPYRECFYATDCPLGFRCSSWGECVQAPPHGDPSGDGGVSDAPGDGDVPSDAARSDATDAADSSNPDAPADGTAVTYCGNPSDCAAGETCSSDGTCRAGNCSTIGCIYQFYCATTSNGPACQRLTPGGCGADRDCGSNERCIDGRCTALSAICTDRSQCGTGKVCAEGRCVVACTNDAPCSPGLRCNTALGICSVNAKSCTRTNDCGSANEVCVDGACVPRCTVYGACGDGGSGVCVDNGCVPGAARLTQCTGNGTICGSGEGQICLRGHCYDMCGLEAGACSFGSASCRTVIEAGMQYPVCVASDMLGDECNPTTSKACVDGKVCIDGFCR